MLQFIKHKQNIILTGPAGTGKSYLAQALGHQACINGYKTSYQITARFLAVLKYAKLDGTYLKQLTRLNKDLLILDDFGLQKLDNQDREILMDIIEDRNETSSTIVARFPFMSLW